MSKICAQNLDGVEETLLIPLYFRALEAQRPDALIDDEKAVDLIRNIDYDFSRIDQVKMGEDDKVVLILRNREFDRYTRKFLTHNPQAIVVHIGCGLDSRFDRVDDGLVEWYDLDLPKVIALRQALIGGEKERYHLLSHSVFDHNWIDIVLAGGPRPLLFLAEGVFMYFTEAQVKSLVLSLQEHFPGAELIFDAFSPFVVRGNNFRLSLSRIGARYHWALQRGTDLENWSQGISLLDEWFYFDCNEARLPYPKWMRHIPLLARAAGIYHYRLGRTG